MIAVHAALVALLGVALDPLISAIAMKLTPKDWYLPAIPGALTLIAAIALLVLTLQWRSVSISAERYTSLRWLPIIAIEKAAGVSQIGLASLEHRYRDYSRNNQVEPWRPWEGIRGLQDIQLPPLPMRRTPQYHLALFRLFLALDGSMIVGGLLLLSFSLILSRGL
jgi:hypothetical protein